MYGPPQNCKRKIGIDDWVRANVFGLEVGIVVARAMMDSARSLPISYKVLEDLYRYQVWKAPEGPSCHLNISHRRPGGNLFAAVRITRVS